MAESEELKNLLKKVKEENEKVGLKLNIQKTKIMASSHITSWEIDGERMETVTDYIFLNPPETVIAVPAQRRAALPRRQQLGALTDPLHSRNQRKMRSSKQKLQVGR